MPRAFLLLLTGALCIAGSFSVQAAAPQVESYPSKPVRIVVPNSAGGSSDILARVLSQKVAEQFGQPLVVENRPGASGNLGASHVAKADPDGYTLFFGTSTQLAVNPSLYRSLPYDPLKDFTPIVLAANLPSLVVVNPNLPVKTVPELTAYLKAHPGTNYASGGNGTPSHLGVELYKRLTGVSMNQVPYKGGARAVTDLLGGQTSVMFAILPEVMPYVKEGKLRALAVTTATRNQLVPQLPTVAESGVEDYEVVGWYALMAPRGTPASIVAKLNKAFNQALAQKEVRDRLAAAGFNLAGGSPDTLANTMHSEIKKWKKVVTDANIALD